MILLILYPFCAYGTAMYHHRRRDVGWELATFICFLFTPLVGGFLLCFTRECRPGYNEPSYSFRGIKIKMPPIKFNWRYLLNIPLKIVVAIAFILILLNPSYNSFKEYSGDLNTNTRKWVCKKEANYLIFSIYERHLVKMNLYDRWVEQKEKERYLGILMNFYPK